MIAYWRSTLPSGLVGLEMTMSLGLFLFLRTSEREGKVKPPFWDGTNSITDRDLLSALTGLQC